MNNWLLLKPYFEVDFKNEIKGLNNDGLGFPCLLVQTTTGNWYTVIAQYDDVNDRVLLEGYSFSLDCEDVKRYVVLKEK